MKYNWQQLEESAKQPVYIDTDATLAQYCDHWQQLELIAIDTEFQRIETFYPIPGVLQVADDRACYLIDPLSVKDFTPFVAVLQNPQLLKVLHSGSEDLELFQNTLQVLPTPVFDTQLAAAFAGWGFTMGLQRLVERTLGIVIDKGETTSDWLKRPLSPTQEEYAARDVAYLPAICQRLKEELGQSGRQPWFEEESRAVLAQAVDTDPEGVHYYRRFSQMWALPSNKLAALRDLTQWREQQSRLRDRPRNRVLRNQTILSVIDTWPKNLYELRNTEDMHGRIVREDGDTILSFLRQGKASAAANPPQPINRPLHIIWNKRLKKLKAVAREAAREIGICPEVLLRKKDLDALVRSRDEQGRYHLPQELQGWRKAIVGDKLLTQLEKFEQQS